jgi:hypothetical protein
MTIDTSPAPTISRVLESLSANEFYVQLDGTRVDGVFRISGLVPFKLEVKLTEPLKPLRDPLKLVKMVQRDSNLPINKWIRESVNAKADIVRPRRTLVIVADDDGVETRRWILKGAWISEISYSEFNTASGDLVEETLAIQWESVEIIWP